MSRTYTGGLFSVQRYTTQQPLQPIVNNPDYTSEISLQAQLISDRYNCACLSVAQLAEVLNVGQSNAYSFLKKHPEMVRVIGRRKVVPVALLATYLVTGSTTTCSQTSS